MKIDNSLKALGNTTAENRTEKNARTDASSSTAPESGVSVELSSHSPQIQSNQTGNEIVDVARVNEIKQAIAEGRFKVNPDVVADRLLKTVQELIGAYRH
jgi:negative regulator of flagellin synthesis FlgM